MIGCKFDEVYVVAGYRTPTGKFGGSLANFEVRKLGAIPVSELLKRTGVSPDDIGEVVIGNVVGAGLGQNIARQVAHEAGIPFKIPAYTINKVCASAAKAVANVAMSIQMGIYDIGIAGGVESMSQAPYILKGARWGYRLWNSELIDGLVHDGLWCAFENVHMGSIAELTAEEYNISREQMDQWAYRSHKLATEATNEGKFKSEIVPVDLGQDKVLDTDETIRPNTSLEKLAKLRPVFKENGKLTAGNSPGLCDGASAMMLASKRALERYKLEPVARLLGFATATLEPSKFTVAPAEAMSYLSELLGVKVNEWDLYEINEAFAVVTLANMKILDLPEDRVNVWGGALALGHAIGSSGTRIAITLLSALRDRKLRRGLIGICHGGGGAVAMAFELL